MNKRQWRVLYRQFLFRVFDLEVLSAHAQGDANRLLGQFAAFLIVISITVAFGALTLTNPNAPGRDPRDSLPLVLTMVAQHFVIATTMLVVGLFAVLSWDATFPDRRDVLVLGPLPVRARSMFLAKVAAVASALGLTIVLLHSAMGLMLPLVFAANAAPAALPALTFDAALPPVEVRDIKGVMDRDLRQQLTTGELAPGSGLGLSIGVWQHGERSVFTYGTAQPDSLFEIGSVSKTFTGLLLARMVEEGKVRLDEPVRELLPPGTVKKPTGPLAGNREITLLDLATHHSGLPEMPDNFPPADPSNPYADYGPEQLYAYLKIHGLGKPEETSFAYSNLGMGLLGQALAERVGRSYADQLREEITGPLGMADTAIQLSADQQRRFIPGHDRHHRPAHAWDLDALAAAGGIRSTAGDMLAYLEANLHPEKYGPLSGPLDFSHRLRKRAPEGQQIALAWFYAADTRTYWHDGATGGYTSHVFFDPQADSAAVVLLNMGPTLTLVPDNIGEHIRERLLGDPAISLNEVLVPASTGLRGVLRSFGAYWFTMLAAGVFIYGAVLALQGLAAQILPRRLFLRLSGHLQLAAIGVILGVYFLQPGFGGLNDLTRSSLWRAIHWLPSYWFLGLYEQLNGSMHPALQPLAWRAWIGLATVIGGTAVIYTASYWRTLRKIVEEPDIGPGSRALGWLPRFGNQAQTAIGQFGVRTLARSKQHRLIVGFYLGIALAISSLVLRGESSARETSVLLWSVSILTIVLAAVGTRVAFALPLDLRANWIFRVIGVRAGLETLAATRRALLLLSVAPVWLGTAVACLWMSPDRPNAAHLLVLGLLGAIVADLCLLRFPKIPFTCSYLPGKSRVHMVLLVGLILLATGPDTALLERHALRSDGATILLLTLLMIAWIGIRRITIAIAKNEDQELRFEEEMPPVVMELGLHRDGVMPLGPQAAR